MVRNLDTWMEADYVGELATSSTKKFSKKELANPGMVFLTISARFLAYLIADHCAGNSGETFVSRKTLLHETGMGNSCYDECIADLQATGVLRIRWEKFPGWSRRWWLIDRERLAELVGPGVEPQVLTDAVTAALEGDTAHVYCSEARVEPTKSRLQGLAKPARLSITVFVIDGKVTLTVTRGMGSGPAFDDEDEDLSGLELTPQPASAVKQDATPQEVAAAPLVRKMATQEPTATRGPESEPDKDDRPEWVRKTRAQAIAGGAA